MRRFLLVFSCSCLFAAAFAAEASAEPAAVAFTAPADGEVVTGAVSLVVVTSGRVERVAFAASVGGGEWVDLSEPERSGEEWTTVWDTSGLSGPARVRATATNPSEEAAAEIDVIVDNDPPAVGVAVSRRAFSPNRDGRADVVRLSATSNEPAHLTVRVVGADGVVEREWKSEKALTAFTTEWNGRFSGTRAPDGRYLIEVTGRDAAGLTDRARSSVVVDTRAPRVAWEGRSPVLDTGERRVSFRYRARDRSATLRLRLVVRSETRRVRSLVRRRRSGPGRIRIRAGSYYPGTYYARLSATDRAGNETMSRKRPWRVHRAVTARVWERVENAGRKVALTFDDCNDGRAWKEILDVLEARRASATFFCPGSVVRRHPDLAARTVREGHAVGSHGWDHADLRGRSISDTQWRLAADRKAWWTAARATSAPLFRPPYGAYDRNVLAAAGRTAHGRVVMWDVDPSDWRRPPAAQIAARVLDDVRPGSIVLLHTLPNTAAALPAILDGLRSRDLSPVDLYRMLP